MTICIGAVCENQTAVVLASDTMVTNSALSFQFEHEERKMTLLSESCIALTSGDALVHTELFGAVRASISPLRQPSILQIVEQIKKCYAQLRRQKIEERILQPRGFDSLTNFYEIQRHLVPDVALSVQSRVDNFDYSLDILVSGVTEGRAHLYGVSNPGTSYCLDAIGFHAIGSGTPHALNTMMATGLHSAVDLHEAFMTVYEAKKLAERAPGVGSRNTDLCIVRNGETYFLPRECIHDLDGLYKHWRRGEPKAKWRDPLSKMLEHGKEGRRNVETTKRG